MKKILAIIMALCLCICFAACGNGSTPSNGSNNGNNAAPSQPAPELTFATGGSTGTYYAYGSVLAEFVSNNSDAVKIKAITGNGSQANIEDLDGGDVQMAFCQSDVMSYAYSGTNLFKSKVDSFSVIAALYLEQVQIVTCNPEIKTVADLKGKTVSVGVQGSGVYFNAVDVFTAYGMSLSDIDAKYQNFGDSTESLKDNKIDAAFVVAGAPTNSIVDLSTAKKAYIVTIDDEHVQKLIQMSPYYSKYVISKDVYGLDEDAQTVAIAAMVLVRDDVSEDVVYSITKTIFDGKDKIQHGKAADLDLSFATSVTAVPFHKGAAKYFAEKNITVKTK
ncbi:MAG: TAXI family TRAP transporter solute-binding subunit [Firmicutes bacterium]|nr:TAXI family TRAP transporter solute-binding subunit [Bacillota bacterium]